MPLADIAEARLVLTDALIRESLTRREGRGRGRRRREAAPDEAPAAAGRRGPGRFAGPKKAKPVIPAGIQT